MFLNLDGLARKRMRKDVLGDWRFLGAGGLTETAAMVNVL